MNTAQWSMKSKIGRLYLVASDKGLRGVFWKDQHVPMARTLKESRAAVRILAKSTRQLKEYFGGKRKKFSLPLDMQGTAFQKSVWTALSRIPYGRTSSYKEVARKIRNPKAVRAVGSANGMNPLCIIVPCHRVIAADGSIGGYSGRSGVKGKLLKMESNLTRIIC